MYIQEYDWRASREIGIPQEISRAPALEPDLHHHQKALTPASKDSEVSKRLETLAAAQIQTFQGSQGPRGGTISEIASKRVLHDAKKPIGQNSLVYWIHVTSKQIL